MTRTRLGLAAATFIALTGCEVFDEVLDGVLDDALGGVFELTDLGLLGVTPAEGFSDPSSPEYGRVVLAVNAEDSLGSPLAPLASDLEIEDGDGEPVPVEDDDEVMGYAQGSFVLLVDGTGSMEETGSGCEGCPTDPQRNRVEAAKILAETLAGCGPDWRQSLMEFSTTAFDPNFSDTRVLADFGSDAAAIGDAADALASDGGTPVWDATSEVIAAVAQDAESVLFSAGDPDEMPEEPVDPDQWGRAIVLISDGQDTSSSTSLDALINQALEAGVVVHTVGLGPASDSVDEFAVEQGAIEDLRQLALETGGYYGFVSSTDDLPELAANIGESVCGGYTELYARFGAPAESGERVWGSIGLKDSVFKVPFTFTAP